MNQSMSHFFPVMTFKLLIFSILAMGFSPTHANDKVTDSLLQVLRSAQSNQHRTELYLSLTENVIKKDFKKALSYAQEALSAAKKDGDPSLQMKAYKGVASVSYFTGLYDQAIIYFSLAAKEAGKVGDDVEAMNNNLNISLINISMGEYKQALISLEKAELTFSDIYKNSGKVVPIPELITLNLNIGACYLAELQLPKAYIRLDSGIRLARSIKGQETSLTKLLTAKAKAKIFENKFDEALQLLQEAENVILLTGDMATALAINETLASLYVEKNDDTNALFVNKQGLVAAQALGSIKMKSTFSKAIYSIYRRKGEADSAIRYLDIITECDAESQSTQAKEALVRKELLQEFEKKEQELLERDQQNKRSFGYALIVISVVGVMSFFAIMVYRSRFRKVNLMRIRQGLEAKQLELETLRLQAELENRDNEISRINYELTKNTLMQGLIGDLGSVTGVSSDQPDQQKTLYSKAGSISKTQAWEEFEFRFQQIHSGFYDRLIKACPGLSLNERRLCAFLKLDMTTKEISDITGQSIRAVNIARTRMRKKMELTNTDTGLFEFLSKL
jgi:tetratricopeptide (TPR) repeat protein